MKPATLVGGVLAAALAAGGARSAWAADPFAWAPPRAPAVVAGKESGARFGLLALTEVEVEVDDIYEAANRQALALAEQRLAAIPGVRGVYGPAGLLDVIVDAAGEPSARPVLARGQKESESEAARQRIVRRADALGWFLTENGRRVRFLVDAPDFDRVAPSLGRALMESGLTLAPAGGSGIETRPLWPDPRRHRSGILPLGFAAAFALFVLVAARRAHFPLGRRRLPRTLAAAVGAAAPFALVPVTGVRLVGALAAAGAAAVAGWGGSARDRPEDARARPRFFTFTLVFAALLVAGGVVLAPRLRIGTRQWNAAPMFFVSVRGDFDEPVVLREVRRLADDLRAQPGVANAWSVADLFLGVTFEGRDTSGIPDDPETLRRVLVQARTDPAVQLELSADHREALIGVRFDDDPTIDRLGVVAHAARTIDRELRHALVRVDLDAPGTSPAARLVGKGILAGDLTERVLRICARSGRTLTRDEASSVVRAARTTALIPLADEPRLATDLTNAVRDFTARHPVPLKPIEVDRMIDRLIVTAVAQPREATDADVRIIVAAAYGPRLSEPVLNATSTALARRLATVRWRHTERLDFREMLDGADLPTEGVLADEVRSATREGMGPIVGLPVADDTAGALHLDAQSIGGAPNDRALSAAWNRALGPGWLAAAGTIGILLMLVGGLPGLSVLPLALAPLAAALAPSAILRETIGLPTLAFFAGALAGGALLAVLAAPAAPPEQRR